MVGRRWITLRQTAEILSVSGCRKMDNRGAIPAVHLGRVVRVDLLELERRLEVQTKISERRPSG